jgi:hypothetical protein
MVSYRIYFVGDRVICGRDDFLADCDESAIQIAHVLFDACADDCLSFDLWQGSRWIALPRLFVPKTFDELSAANQACTIETEERIVAGRWAIAKSRRLLDTLARKSSNPLL